MHRLQKFQVTHLKIIAYKSLVARVLGQLSLARCHELRFYVSGSGKKKIFLCHYKKSVMIQLSAMEIF